MLTSTMFKQEYTQQRRNVRATVTCTPLRRGQVVSASGIRIKKNYGKLPNCVIKMAKIRRFSLLECQSRSVIASIFTSWLVRL